jgi:predicted GIY-YIG superfamily endonuclease
MINIPIFSDKIRKIIKTHDNNIELVFTNLKTSNQLFTQTKDKILMTNQTKLVYRIMCECGKFYTGLTYKQYLKTRISQHKKDCENVKSLANKCGILLNDTREEIKLNLTVEKRQQKIDDLNKLGKLCDKSGLTSHFSTTGHNFDFNGTKIIEKSDNRFKLGILEMIEIRKFVGVNKNTDTENLNTAYFGIIDKLKNDKNRWKKKKDPPDMNE